MECLTHRHYSRSVPHSHSCRGSWCSQTTCQGGRTSVYVTHGTNGQLRENEATIRGKSEVYWPLQCHQDRLDTPSQKQEPWPLPLCSTHPRLHTSTCSHLRGRLALKGFQPLQTSGGECVYHKTSFRGCPFLLRLHIIRYENKKRMRSFKARGAGKFTVAEGDSLKTVACCAHLSVNLVSSTDAASVSCWLEVCDNSQQRSCIQQTCCDNSLNCLHKPVRSAPIGTRWLLDDGPCMQSTAIPALLLNRMRRWRESPGVFLEPFMTSEP